MLENASSLSYVIESIAGEGCRVLSKRSVSGGDINSASMLTISGGRKFFLKENRSELAGMFQAEAAGLIELSSGGSEIPPVPVPLALGSDGNKAFLMMELLESGHLTSGAGFGASLAALHRSRRRDKCGFSGDNWIGSTPQPNLWMSSWHEFFAVNRLGFQWNLARENGFGDTRSDKAMASILKRLPDLLPGLEAGGASLLHGDLWGGNWIAGTDGRAYLIDPAVYYGHREADIAMTELFGGFPSGFRQGYADAWPLEPGFQERRDLYNLYHILNHLNLFGRSYWGGVESTLMRYA